MRFLPVILLALALPAGVLGYTAAWAVLSVLAPSVANGILGLFLPLLAGGLCMLPFLIPFVDRQAKRDLAAHRSTEAPPEPEDRGPVD